MSRCSRLGEHTLAPQKLITFIPNTEVSLFALPGL
jgi:hypothetical protein